ncbi:MAG: PHP domain-containing protein [Clostridia bacterium]
MQLAVDLHLHTALSPCSEAEMTPNNIVQMAVLKKLDAIAITDHNSCDNVAACMQVAAGKLLVVPAMELESSEAVHILAYLPDYESLLELGAWVRIGLPQVKNRPEIFGRQLVFDCHDEEIAEELMLLANSLNYPLNKVVTKVRSLGGVVVPAHVNRASYSLLSILGDIPAELNFTTLEVYGDKNLAVLAQKYQIITSSDAHNLAQIMERAEATMLEVEEKSTAGILAALVGKIK